MIRRIGIGVVVLGALVVAYPFAKDAAVDWYVENHYVRETPFPASETPDQIVLTWPTNPATSIAVNWRTAQSVKGGRMAYRAVGSDAEPIVVEATAMSIGDRLLENDPSVNRFTAITYDLSPATAYEYRLATGQDEWTEWAPFTTGPAEGKPFSFMYLGDPQRGFEEWGALVEASYKQFPGTAFYVIAGDLVNDGNWRNEWDEFFAYSSGVFSRVPIVPCLGNHDVDDDMNADMYLASMALPENGPATIGPERAFSFTYSNALFVVLDSNLTPDTQTAWLEKVLSDSDATWKFAVYHHPAYASRRARDNRELREQWGALFDKYHVDIAFQGHDHAYLRTFPMRAGERTTSAAEGTYYIVSVSGTKFYEQEEHDYAEVAFPETMTYQTIDIETDPNRLTYRAYNTAHAVLDEVIIEK